MLSGRSYSQTIVEKLDDGSYIIKIEDTEYRALPPNKMRELISLRQNYDLLTGQYKSLNDNYAQFRVTSEDRFKTLQAQDGLSIQAAKDSSKFWEDQFAKEKTLRLKYQENMGRCSGKIIFFRLCTF